MKAGISFSRAERSLSGTHMQENDEKLASVYGKWPYMSPFRDTHAENPAKTRGCVVKVARNRSGMIILDRSRSIMNCKKIVKVTGYIVLGLMLLVSVGAIVGSDYMVKYSLSPRVNREDVESVKSYFKEKNPDLWMRFSRLYEMHRVSFHWIKGHAGHPENESPESHFQ